MWRVYVANLVRLRIIARQGEKFDEADRLRDLLKNDYGVVLADHPDKPGKTDWKLIQPRQKYMHS